MKCVQIMMELLKIIHARHKLVKFLLHLGELLLGRSSVHDKRLELPQLFNLRLNGGLEGGPLLVARVGSQQFGKDGKAPKTHCIELILVVDCATIASIARGAKSSK